ncbi:MAG: PEP/pyruvate-binding domain-containing protein, partial [Syntrophobacteraceae bacterium]
PQGSVHLKPSEAEGVRVALINHFVSNQLPFIGVAKKHITIRDVDELIDHAYWNRRRSGKVGGKAAGMFLAYKILLPRLADRDHELEMHVEMPESHFFNSGILSDFLDYNDLYYFHSQKYKTREEIEKEYGTIAELFRKATFPQDTVKDFKRFLEKVGEHPLILRSSSLLEDNLGHTFSGKYDSVFISNQGDFDTRLEELMWGFKQVLMSTYNPAAILYRRDHNLLDFDERMSVLVQKVVGRRFGKYFFPFLAGVAFSLNAYGWTNRIVKEDGLVRIVMGLGTRAVDRIGDYPRMVPLSHPTLRPEVTKEQIKKYSQRMVDVINFETRQIETISYHDLLGEVDHPDSFYALSYDQDGHLAPPMFKGQEMPLNKSCITFDNLLGKTSFAPLMKKVLKRLEKAYGRPVEMEFAWDDGKLYILQCRMLAIMDRVEKVTVPQDVPPERMLFRNTEYISNNIIKDIEYIVYVDPRAYADIEEYEDRMSIVRVVSRMNRVLDAKRYALFGPARWGSNDIKLGVKVGYEDINRTLILGEIAFEEEGSTPEVSYGTHFFNDLVEAQITPLAIYPDQPGMALNEHFLLHAPNLLESMVPDLASYSSVVHVVHVPSVTDGRLLQVFQDGKTQQGVGLFAKPKRKSRAENHENLA